MVVTGRVQSPGECSHRTSAGDFLEVAVIGVDGWVGAHADHDGRNCEQHTGGEKE